MDWLLETTETEPMKTYRKIKCIALLLLNALLLALFAEWITLPASAAPPPNSTAVTVYGQSGDLTTGDVNHNGLGADSLS